MVVSVVLATPVIPVSLLLPELPPQALMSPANARQATTDATVFFNMEPLGSCRSGGSLPDHTLPTSTPPTFMLWTHRRGAATLCR